MSAPKKILVSPLNWGLGHAARSAVIIRGLLKKNCEVVMGADGDALHFLEKEFPQLQRIVIPDVHIKIPAGIPPQWYFLYKTPTVFSQLRTERNWLRENVLKLGIDGIISDNRYGLNFPGIPSVLVTHQLQPKLPLIERSSQNFLRKLIAPFDTIWIPDEEAPNNLSGELSNSRKFHPDVKRIGWLSRFKPEDKREVQKEKFILIVLSGPETQRTKLENWLVSQINHFPLPVVLVRGTEKGIPLTSAGNLKEIHDLVTADILFKLISGAEFVISRAGYSTLMDLCVMQKKAIIIPTPGQWEQKYIAKYAQSRNWFRAIKQGNGSLEKILKEDFHEMPPAPGQENKLDIALDNFLKRIP